MSLLDRQTSAFSQHSVTDGSDALTATAQTHLQLDSPTLSIQPAAALMSGNSPTPNTHSSGNSRENSIRTPSTDGSDAETSKIASSAELDPHDDARAIVRLLQCRQCGLPLRQPLTLPCGNSICRNCLPELHKRENITYPTTPGRSEGFVCPFTDCAQEHALGDGSTDVVLSKVLDRVSIEIARCRPLTSDTPIVLEECLPFRNSNSGTVTDTMTWVTNDNDASTAPQSRTRVLSGGRLLATFIIAELGELRYDAEVVYHRVNHSSTNLSTNVKAPDTYAHDRSLLSHLKDVTCTELDCQVCIALMLDPLTTPCGHTFCRKCVARLLDHSPTCPVCRRTLTIPPGAPASYPSNRRLSALLLTLCPELVAARATQVEVEEAALRSLGGAAGSGGWEQQELPLFVCTLAYPGMPTFLHVFEPRYRLMIRRAMESASRRFGMVLHNARGALQGPLGRAPFCQFGTLLDIENVQLLPDGRSIIETRGVARFRVLEHGVRDGYVVGHVERLDDISLAEEEALEAAEVSTAHDNSPTEGLNGGTASGSASQQSSALSSLSTIELLRIGTDFVTRMRAAAAPWLAANYAAAYGPMPDDPALFPYWFASVLPIADQEKYRLLPARSVRDRLKITAAWVRRVEGMRW